MKKFYVEELLNFIEKLYETDVPSVNLDFVRGQLYSLYECEDITYNEYHKYDVMLVCTRKAREQRILEYGL